MDTLRELRRGAVGVGRLSLTGDTARASEAMLATDDRPEMAVAVTFVVEGRAAPVPDNDVPGRDSVVLEGLEIEVRDSGRAVGAFDGGGIGVGDCSTGDQESKKPLCRIDDAPCTHLCSIWSAVIQQQTDL